MKTAANIGGRDRNSKLVIGHLKRALPLLQKISIHEARMKIADRLLAMFLPEDVQQWAEGWPREMEPSQPGGPRGKPRGGAWSLYPESRGHGFEEMRPLREARQSDRRRV